MRLFLIAPSFSIPVLNRCKWIDVPVSLFSYKCIQLDGSTETIPVFSEIAVPSVPIVVESYTIADRLKYIADSKARNTVEALIKEVQAWDPAHILVEPTKYDISLKVSGRVFSYLGPRRKYFMVYTYDNERKWTGYPIHQAEELDAVTELLRSNVDRLRGKHSSGPE